MVFRTWHRSLIGLMLGLSVACLCLLSACGGEGSAQALVPLSPTPIPTSTPVPTPIPTPRPSLELEGQGSLTATGPCLIGAGAICPRIFTGTVSGPPLGTVDLIFNVFTANSRVNVNGSGGCFPASGTGQLNGGHLTLVFSGTFCNPGGRFAGAGQQLGRNQAQTDPPVAVTYTLTGSVQIYTTQLCPASGQWTAMSGTLNAFGEMHTSGPTATPAPTPTPTLVNPLPTGPNDAIISIIGAAGQLPAPCPSP
jgi:hypothetical protein